MRRRIVHRYDTRDPGTDRQQRRICVLVGVDDVRPPAPESPSQSSRLRESHDRTDSSRQRQDLDSFSASFVEQCVAFVREPPELMRVVAADQENADVLMTQPDRLPDGVLQKPVADDRDAHLRPEPVQGPRIEATDGVDPEAGERISSAFGASGANERT